MKNLVVFLSSQKDGGLLLTRIMMGVILIAHGWAKFNFGWAIGFFGNTLKFPVPSVLGPFITVLEIGGGAALILGLVTRYLGILYTLQFIVAAYVQWIVFSKGFVFTSLKTPGAELELLLLFTGILLATHGAGKYSLDKMLKLE